MDNVETALEGWRKGDYIHGYVPPDKQQTAAGDPSKAVLGPIYCRPGLCEDKCPPNGCELIGQAWAQ